MPDSRLTQLAHWIKQSSYTVALTGAGMSTESGIPDFRSKEGWWKKIDPTTVATVQALNNNYDLFRDYYQKRLQIYETCAPHRGHYILAEWEKKGLLQAIATQNVDGFHQQAGSKNVYELHGSIRTFRCQSCHSPAGKEEFLRGNACSKCGGKLRPNIVLFGEMLPQQAWNASLQAIQRADLVLVIGTSLTVSPVNQLPVLAKGKKVFINADETERDDMFDLVLRGKAGVILQEIDEMVRAI